MIRETNSVDAALASGFYVLENRTLAQPAADSFFKADGTSRKRPGMLVRNSSLRDPTARGLSLQN